MIKFVVTYIDINGDRRVGYVQAKNKDEALYHFMDGRTDVLKVISLKEKV